MKTTYKVTGERPYMGHQPGEAFEADLEPDQERRALERGSISKQKNGKATGKQQEEAE